ncbi:Hypothetical predicted protein, partial [Scomber scombrus]
MLILSSEVPSVIKITVISLTSVTLVFLRGEEEAIAWGNDVFDMEKMKERALVEKREGKKTEAQLEMK